jgi:hypothetical protein
MRTAAIAMLVLLASSTLEGARLHVGGASTSITPDRPVALMGQRHLRISTRVESPCLAVALAIESREGDRSAEQAVFVACDLSFIPNDFRDAIETRLQKLVPEFDVRKLIVSATHTHTAPVHVDGAYEVPSEGVMPPAEYIDFATARIAAVAAEAWKKRTPATVGWGLGHAVVARNRLAVYDDGKAQMYGPTTKSNFARLEGYEDHGVEVLCFWDTKDQLIATSVNVACPAQDAADDYTVNADFWHPGRERLRKKFGDHLAVLGWIGAAGDQSPWPMFRKPAEKRMLQLRGLTSLEAIGERIVRGWEEAYAGAERDRRAEVPFHHTVENILLPMRQVTQEQYLEAKTKAADTGDEATARWNRRWHQKVIDRYESQQPGDTYDMRLHVVRLGDTAIATNEFELYTDYGLQMKARSPAVQTFVIQLCGPGPYLPTDRALPGGAYGSVIQSGLVGPDGGKELVEKTLAAINALWPKSK